eukprot:XP_011679367.1 PREDICTED: receptor for egg jelly 6 isoform X1 [Strongylocentrotus purpuratus]
MARTLSGMPAWMPGISRARNSTHAVNAPLMELLVLLMMLCLCGCHVPGAEMGKPCRHIPYDEANDNSDVFKWPLPTPDDGFRPRGIPHCLEDIEQCQHGFTASFNVTADIETVFEGDDVIDFAPRFGNILDSNVYDRGWKMPVTLRLEKMDPMQKIGVFKVRVMTNDLVWNAEFSSRLDHPMLVGVTWRHDIGLDVYVDDICAGFDDVPQKIPDEAETQSGDAISTVPADTFQFVEFLRPAGSAAELLLDFQSEDTIYTYYLGCLVDTKASRDLFTETSPIPPKDSTIKSCRISCSMIASAYAVIGKNQCNCVDDIVTLDHTRKCGQVCHGYRSLPCGSIDEWSVYLTSSLISPSQYLPDVRPGDAPVLRSPPLAQHDRYRRSTLDEDTETPLVRHRRSANFIKVDSIEGLVNTLLNFTYVVHTAVQTDTSQLACLWTFGDGTVTKNQHDAEHETQYQHQYTQAGDFTFTVDCGDIEDSASVTVWSSFQGLTFSVQQHGTTTTLSDVTIQVTLTSGSQWPVKAMFVLNGQEMDFEESPTTSNTFETTWTPTKFGIFPIDAVISNKFEEDIPISVNVTVGEAISGLAITTSGSLGTNLPIQIIVEISGGSNVTVDVDFDDGDPISQQLLIDDYTWIRRYSTPGTKNIIVTASNVFGTDSTNTSIDVLQSVTGLQLSLTPDVVNTNENINAQLTAGTDVIPGVTCTIQTGDGVEFVKSDTILDSTFEFSVNFNYSQEFLNPVKVSATCSNAFSNQTVEKYVVVGKVVKNCSIIAPDAQEVGENKETVIVVEGGNSLEIQVNFGDGDVVTFDSQFPGDQAVNHSFNAAGVYNVTATVTNAISSGIECSTENATIIVQESVPPADQFTLSASPQAIDLTIENQINFTLTLNSGQSIRGDTYVTFLFSQQCTCSLSMKLENHATLTGAIYNISGSYIVTAVISNRVSSVIKQIQVGAMYQLNEFSVSVSEPALLVGDVVEFTVVPVNGTEIMINVTWDDGSQENSYLTSATSVTFNHTYSSPGDYEVCGQAFNALSLSKAPQCETIQILHPVQGLTFGINTPLVLDDTAEFEIGLQPGLPYPSHMNCIIDLGDDATTLMVNEGDLSAFPVNVKCGYTPAVKNYLATLNCHNVLGSSNLTLAVTVRKPISQIFQLTLTESFYWLTEALVEYTLSVTTGEDIPVGYADFYWDFGDGNYSQENKIMLDSNEVKRNRFTVEGLYKTNLTISYGLWSGILTATLSVAEKRSWEVLTKYFGGASDGQYGGGQNETWFYEDQLLRFTPEPLYDDTHYTWKYSVDQPSTTIREFDHEFETTGVFAVTVEASFPLYSDNLVTFVHIVSPFTFEDIDIVDSGNRNLKLKAYSKLNITLMGTDMYSPLCILWMFCNETIYFSGPPNCYNAPYASGGPGVAWTTDTQLLTHVEFNTPGIFNLTVVVTNNMDSDDSTITLLKTITIVGCTGPPEVEIRGDGGTQEQPKKYLRSEQINLASTVRLRCYGLEETPQFQWSTKMIDDLNGTFTDLDNEALPDYTFPPLTFAVALYNLTMTVTVTETSPPLSGIDYVYMRIVSTPLIVVISGGTARTVNGKQNITFNATESQDPDEELGDQDLSKWNFTWSCYREDNGVTPVPTVDPTGESICEYSKADEHTVPGETKSLFTIGALRLDATYTIKVTANHADGRLGSYEQAITTVPGYPVQAKIDCIQNCLKKVNPTSLVAYQASCLNCATQNATFRWEMKIGMETREEEDLAAKADTDLTKSGLVIRANVLESGKFYYVRVYVEEPGLLEGFTEVYFYTNLPPFGGNCNIEPRTGTALNTDFTATCKDWKDEGDEAEFPDVPLRYVPLLRYRIQYRPQGEEAYSQLVPAGETGIIKQLKFSIGPEAFNYTFEILFTVLDKFGGMDQANTTIQVIPGVATKEGLVDLFGTGGDIDTFLQSKDPEAGMRYLSAVISVADGAALDVADTILVKDKTMNVLTNMSGLAKTSDNINLAADTFSTLYAKSPPPSGYLAMNAATALGEMTGNYADIKSSSADDIKRTGDSLIFACGNMFTSTLPSTSTNSSSETTPTTVSPQDEEEQIKEAKYEAKLLSSMLLDVIEVSSDMILSKQVAGQEAAVTMSSTLQVRSQVNAPEDIGTGDEPIALGGVTIGLPPAFDFFGEEIGQNLLAMKVVDFPESNPLSYGGGSGDIGSGVTTIEFQTANKNKLVVSGTKEPISLTMKTNTAPPETEEIRANISQKSPMSYHRFNITKPDQDFRAIIRSDSTDGLWVFAKLQSAPLDTSYDVVKRLPRVINGTEGLEESSTEEISNTFVLTKEEHCGNGSYVIGIMPAGSDEEFELLNSTTTQCSGEAVGVQLPSEENTTYIELAYNFSTYVSSCIFFDSETEEWKSDGCWTGIKTTSRDTHCLCNHLTSFAASFFVPPNKIDFSTVFDKNILDNFAAMGTIIGFTSAYLLLLIYARRKDKQDIIKWGVTPLSDNHPSHTYGYQVTVETGVRPGAGTKSNVGIIISGEDADTGARVLDDPKRPIFQSGSINSFLMTTAGPLGLLAYVRIWHDNSGGGGQAGWFLSKVAVMDLQTGKEFFFLCEQWLAVEQGDGDVDRTLFVASKKDLTQVGQLVFTSGRKNLSDQHLWFSLFSRPTRSSFNRCQRLCCCITLLYTSMIANAMFYKTETTAANSQAIIIGPITVTPQQISIGFISSLIVMPVNLIIAQIFRKARPLDPDAPDPLIALIRRIFTMKKKRKGEKSIEQLSFEEKRHDMAISEKQVEVEVGVGQPPPDPLSDPSPAEPSAAAIAAKKKYPLPHWTIYIAYALAFVACFISCFFSVLYSLEWGKEKAEEWLKSMVVSFFSSAFIIQPAKVIVIVFIVSIIFKKPSKMNDADAEGLKDKTINKLQTDEEYLHEDSLTAGKVPGYSIRPKTAPTKQILQEARKERLRDMQVSGVIRDAFLYALFLMVVLYLAYINRDPQAFLMSETIRNTFVRDSIDYLVDGVEPVTFGALSQSTPDEFWNYIEQTLIPGLYGYKYYNGEQMHWRDTRFLRDWQSYRVGPARLRQLRNPCLAR